MRTNKMYCYAVSCLFLSVLTCRGLAVAAESLTVFDSSGAHIYVDLSNRSEVVTPLRSLDGPMNMDCFDDLIRYFEQMTGTALPNQPGENLLALRAERIDPAVDAQDSDPLGLQGYCIEVTDQGITLKAPTSLGIYNAIYDILFQWGCRWIMPGELGEVIPQQSHLALAKGSFRKHISMDSRVEGGVPAEYTLWRARNRMGFERWLSFSHNWTRAIPPSVYFEKHPEYYALIGGKRMPTQVATTNPEVIAIMIQVAKSMLKNNPTLGSFPMDADDNLLWDQSPEALALDPPVRFNGLPSLSDRIVHFANAVGAGIEKDFPDRLVGFYAYSNHQLPPVNVKPRANVGIGFCRSGYDLLRYMPREDVPSTLEYWDHLAGWLDICKNVYCYEYDPISWTGGLPCPIYLERAKALKKQHELGVLGCWTDGLATHQAANYINRYMEIRMKADASQDPYDVLADMCHAFFGPAGQAMTNYYEILDEVTSYSSSVHPQIESTAWGYEMIFPDAIVQRSRASLNEALAIIGNQQPYARRLEMVRLAQDYLESFLSAMAASKAGDYEGCLAKWADVDRAIVALNSADPTWIDIKDARHRMNTPKQKAMGTYFPDRFGFVRTWKVLDPVPNPLRNLDGWDVIFPEDRFAPGVVADGSPVKLTDGTTLQWRDHTSPDGQLDFERATGHVAGEQGDFIGGYAALVIESPAMTELRFLSSSCSPYRFWLNGRELFHLDNWNADYPGQFAVNTLVPAGRNLLIVRYSQQGLSRYAGRAGVWFQILEPDGSLPKQVTFSTDLAVADAVNPSILENAIPQEGRFSKDSYNQGVDDRWYDAAFNDDAWPVIPIGTAWENTPVGSYDGFAWYRIRFARPEGLEDDQELILNFAGVDEQAWIWLNGQKLGERSETSTGRKAGDFWNEPFFVKLSAKQLKPQNILTVRVHDGGYQGGIYKPINLMVIQP